MVETIVEPKDVLCNRPELSQTVTRKQTPIADMTALRRGAPSIVKDVVLLKSRGLT
jgi:hypothetical protein